MIPLSKEKPGSDCWESAQFFEKSEMNPPEARQGRTESAADDLRRTAPGILSARRSYLLLGMVAVLMISDFVLRGIVPAGTTGRTDFSEVYTSAWLWRHGQNFYNSSLATLTQERLIGVSVQVAPIYPPTTFVLLSPLTILPWKWANFLWMMLCFAAVGATIFLVWRIGGFRGWSLKTMALMTFLLSFDPLHQAFHLGNLAVLVVPIALWAILLAEREKDVAAGFVVGMATCLKPQIGIWILIYYLLRGRTKMFLAALAAAVPVAVLLLSRSAVLLDSLPDYRANLHYWFAPGRPYGFSEGALPFHVNIVQVILYQWLHSVLASNVIAYVLYLSGIAFWGWMLWRARFRISAPLAIASLIALSFISLYHSVADTTILTLALAWVIPAEEQPWTRTRIAIGVIFLLMMMPGHSALMRLSPHLAASITTAWWWHLFVARYFVWLLSALNVALLSGMWESAREIRSADEASGQSFLIPRANPAIY
jgi:hypothetical protein